MEKMTNSIGHKKNHHTSVLWWRAECVCVCAGCCYKRLTFPLPHFLHHTDSINSTGWHQPLSAGLKRRVWLFERGLHREKNDYIYQSLAQMTLIKNPSVAHHHYTIKFKPIFDHNATTCKIFMTFYQFVWSVGRTKAETSTKKKT